jgi:ABC-2 type transport system permease protein
MLNVYRHELRQARNGMLGWIISLVLVTLMFVSLFPAFSQDVEASRKLLENFPPQIRDMFGLSLETFFTFLGFYAYTFTYVGLVGAVQGMNLGLTMLSREVSTKTTDFLLAKPASRTQIFVSKLCAALTVIFITNIVLVGATLLMTIWFGAWGFDLGVFGLLCGAFLLVQLMFLSLGILISQLIRIKSIISVSLGVTFGFFAIGLLQALARDDALRYATPFKFFDHLSIVANGSYEQPFVWLSIAVIIIPSVIGYVLYRLRDMRSAL